MSKYSDIKFIIGKVFTITDNASSLNTHQFLCLNELNPCYVKMFDAATSTTTYGYLEVNPTWAAYGCMNNGVKTTIQFNLDHNTISESTCAGAGVLTGSYLLPVAQNDTIYNVYNGSKLINRFHYKKSPHCVIGSEHVVMDFPIEGSVDKLFYFATNEFYNATKSPSGGWMHGERCLMMSTGVSQAFCRKKSKNTYYGFINTCEFNIKVCESAVPTLIETTYEPSLGPVYYYVDADYKVWHTRNVATKSTPIYVPDGPAGTLSNVRQRFDVHEGATVITMLNNGETIRLQRVDKTNSIDSEGFILFKIIECKTIDKNLTTGEFVYYETKTKKLFKQETMELTKTEDTAGEKIIRHYRGQDPIASGLHSMLI